MERILNVTYASSLQKLCEINSSFDAGVLKVAYPGENRNKTFISKDAFERAIASMFNCPVVCNYNRDTDTLGGHDMEIVKNDSGDLTIVNVTTPVGCVPESAKYWWENVEEEDGSVHEYLFVDVLLWKRQEAYNKIKRDGIVSQSMEIGVKSAEFVNDIYHINDFEFRAFTLIGVTPCFESASLELCQLFDKHDFKEQLTEMMRDLKESYNLISTSFEVDDKHPQENFTEGGNEVLDNEINAESVEATIEIEADKADTLAQPKDETSGYTADAADPVADSETDAGSADSDGGEEEDNKEEQYALTRDKIDTLRRALHEITIDTEWGTEPRYLYEDSDFDASEVYCWDIVDWLLYGFSYQASGDSIVIDFDSKKRKKYIITDYDEGNQASPFAEVYNRIVESLHEAKEWEEKYQALSTDHAKIESEIAELREYHDKSEEAKADATRNELFAQFQDLSDIPEYTTLVDNCKEYDIQTLEEKCYAIRGKYRTAKFSLDTGKSPRLPVESFGRDDDPEEPYGGLFVEYGTAK